MLRSISAPVFRLSSHVLQSPSNTNHFFINVTLLLPRRKPLHTYALVDSGATLSCISDRFASRHSLPRSLRDTPLPITAVDNRPIASGLVSQDVISCLKVRDHSERISLAVVSVAYPIILGLDWLRRHNPSIDWTRGQLALSCCGANPGPLFAFGQGYGLARLEPQKTSLSALSTTSVGLGLGLNGNTLRPSVPDCVSRAPGPTRLHGCLASSMNIPSTPLLSTRRPIIGSGHRQIFTALHSPRKSTATELNISFVNTSRYTRFAKHGESALIWYTPNLGIHETVANVSSSPLATAPSVSPPAEPPPEPGDNDVLSQIPLKYHPWSSVFSPTEVEDLPPHRPYDAAIDLEEGKTPPFGPIYSLSQDERVALFDYIEKNLKKGFIRRSTSPAASPILFVKKKTGELRLCVDYRGLNSITKKNRYPLPLVGDLLERVEGCKIFTVLDLKNAFNLIRIKDGDEWKTAFRTHLGLFEYTVMPFGLTNAPATFQAFIQDTLRDLLDITCVVYIDDILIFSKNQADHDVHVQQVLERLQAAGLYANAKKCEFDKSQVEYLGYLVGADGIKMNPKKLATVSDWPVPRTLRDVQAFLGFTNFYRRFIDRYAEKALALNALTKKDTRGFTFTPAAGESFESLKSAFLSAPVLRHFDPTLPSTLMTDASDFAIAGIHLQPDEHGLLHPVAFFSRKLSPAEINYEVYDKELLAIVDSFRDMRAWLIGTGTPVSVISDHRNLEYFMTSRVLNRRQARWSMFLSEFNFRLDYAPGKHNPADAPSRRPDFAPSDGDEVLLEQRKTIITSVHTERLDPCDKPEALPGSPHAPSPSQASISSLSSLAIDNSELLERFKSATREDVEWREALATGSQDFEVHDNLVFHKGRLYVPAPLRAAILHSRHDALTAGHPGRARTQSLVERDYSWPGLQTFVRRYVSACDTCARIKAPRHKPYGLLQPLDIPDRPWRSISMDYIVKLPLSHGYDSIWVVCDRLTRAAHFIPCCETMTAPDLAWLFLDRIFRYHGLPESIISDRGSTFISKFWRELTKLLGIDLRTSTAYHPQSDGLTERTNQTLEVYLRAYVSYQQDDWVDYLPLAEFAFNNTPNTSTKQSPYFANFGYNPTFEPRLTDSSPVPAAADFADRLVTIQDELRAELKHAQQVQARFHDRHTQQGPRFQTGDLVWLLRRNIKTTRPTEKLDYRKLGPYPVLRVLGKRSYALKLPASMSRLHPVFDVSLLEPYDNDAAAALGRPRSRPVSISIDTDSPEIETFLDCRKIGRRYDYFVQWRDQPISERSWVPLSDIPRSLDELLERFHRRHPGLPCPHRVVRDRAYEFFDLPEPSGSSIDSPMAAQSRARSPSPPPTQVNPRTHYEPPSRTTLRSGRVARPPTRLNL